MPNASFACTATPDAALADVALRLFKDTGRALGVDPLALAETLNLEDLLRFTAELRDLDLESNDVIENLESFAREAADYVPVALIPRVADSGD